MPAFLLTPLARYLGIAVLAAGIFCAGWWTYGHAVSKADTAGYARCESENKTAADQALQQQVANLKQQLQDRTQERDDYANRIKVIDDKRADAESRLGRLRICPARDPAVLPAAPAAGLLPDAAPRVGGGSGANLAQVGIGADLAGCERDAAKVISLQEYARRVSAPAL